MGYIAGTSREQIILFPESIEEYVAEDNTVRVIDAYVDSLDFETLGFTKAEPKATGRPPYSPQDLLKLYVYGYMNRVRSSRRLETESKRNVEVIWLLKKLSPDHKTIARFRQENGKALKAVFRDFVKLCMKLNLYGKELVAIDGSKFKAVNSKERNFTEKKLQERIARIDAKIEEYLRELEDSDWKENAAENEKSTEDIAQIIIGLSERRELYQSYAQEMSESGETQKSLTDPDSRLMMANGKMDVCYNVQSAVDSKNKMIIHFDVINSPQDHTQMPPMAKAAEEILEVEGLSVTADNGYDSASDVAACILQGIQPHVAGADYDICLPSEEPTDEAVSEENAEHNNGRCVYLPDRNIAICPMGKILYPSGYKKNHRAALFRNGRACSSCMCKCTEEKYKSFEIRMPKSKFTKEYNDKNLCVKQTHIKSDKQIVSQRKSIVEHPFGTIKRGMDAGYFLTRGFANVIGELSITFLSYNLKRAINILGVKKLMEAVTLS